MQQVQTASSNVDLSSASLPSARLSRIGLASASVSRRTVLEGATVNAARIAAMSIVPMFLTGSEAEAGVRSPKSIKSLLNQDLDALIAYESNNLKRSEIQGRVNPDHQQKIGRGFDQMMSYAPQMDPYAQGFHEGKALSFLRSLGKLFLAHSSQASSSALRMLQGFSAAGHPEAATESIQELISYVNEFSPTNESDVFLKKFMQSYLDNYYNFSIALEDLHELFSDRTKTPHPDTLARTLRSHAKNLKRMIYKSAFGDMDIAVRKPVWKAVDKLAGQAEALRRG